MATRTAPTPTNAIPVQPMGERRSPRKVTAKTATSTTLSLSIGATRAASPSFSALKLGDAARVAPIDKLSVVLVAVFAVTFLGERLSPIGWTGIAFVGVGAVLVAI